MTGNIIGEDFYPYVLDQISSRQLKHGKGINGALRSYEDINYLSNRNAWIKMASSVDVQKPIRVGNIGLDSGGAFNGINLAKKAVLFNTLVDFSGGGGINKNSNDVLPNYTTRHNIAYDKSIWNNAAYGLGGTDFGFQPPPGIISVSVDSINRGSIRKATVHMKAYNKFQFELIELLYLRLGFTMMLEWGWNKYINDKSKKVEPMGNTLIENWWFTAEGSTQLEVLKQIESYRERYCGNYDGFFGKVSNYKWKFQSDGSYDISLNLITVGDIVESLQARVAATSNFLIGKSVGYPSIFSSMGQTVIDQWLYESIQNDVFADNTDYIIHQVAQIDLATQTGLTGGVTYNYSTEDSPELLKYQYHVTFGELIRKLAELCIPKIKNGTSEAPQLYFDDDSENILVKVFPNQISIDPRVCLFEPYLSKIDFQEIHSNMGALKPYITNRENIIFGKLMNLYINYDFIISTLKTNTDKYNNLSLYRFLESICDGINLALGGVNKIQPIIKDDNIITFIDQALQSSSILNKNKKDSAHLEVYGYNMKDHTSNFVKNIEFQTKLSKESSAMISIGATAGGDETSVKNGDATAFSKWNEGLVDRFCQHIIDPSEKTSFTPLEMRAGVLDMNNWSKSNSLSTLKIKYKEETSKLMPVDYVTSPDRVDWNLITTEVSKILKDPTYSPPAPLIFSPVIKYIAEKEKTEVENYIANKLPTEKEFTTDSSTAFLAYLLDAFSGVASQKVDDDGKNVYYGINNSSDPQYFKYNDQFINKGRPLYQAYLSYKSRQQFIKDNTHSSQIGFLPLEFTLTTDGISGIKIYNKLNISQYFLPKNYPTSFDFIIVGLNHKIDNSGWDTEINSLSTSNLNNKMDEAIIGSSLIVTPQSEGRLMKRLDSAQIITNKIQIAKSLKQNGLTVSQAAAIMGNMAQESSFNPNALNKKDLNGYASYGLIQWNEKYYPQIYKICAPYRNNNSPTTQKTLIDLQMKYLFNSTSRYDEFKKNSITSNVEKSAWIFADIVEICHLCNKGESTYRNSYQYIRTKYAHEIYQQLITPDNPIFYNNL